MAEAMINGAASSEWKFENLRVCEVNPQRINYLEKEYPGLNFTHSLENVISESDLIVVAVKPQTLPQIGEQMKELKVSENSVFMSICAGTPIQYIKEIFGTKKVIRTMPNTPAIVMQGITCWCGTGIDDLEREQTKQLLSSFGEEIEVTNEHYLDMATAISGSGPAYVFLTMEAMIDAAVHTGFPRDIATKLVLHTLEGSAKYASLSKENLSTLKNNVTSPGGTTASALYELERGGYRTVMANAVWAAYRRALELGGKNSNVGPGRSR